MVELSQPKGNMIGASYLYDRGIYFRSWGRLDIGRKGGCTDVASFPREVRWLCKKTRLYSVVQDVGLALQLLGFDSLGVRRTLQDMRSSGVASCVVR